MTTLDAAIFVHLEHQRSSVFPSTFLCCLVGFVQNLHEVFGHEVWLLEGSVIPFQVLHCQMGNVTCVGVKFFCVSSTTEVQNLLTEAEKECVHTHVVNTEESVSYEVASNHNGLFRTDWERQNKDIRVNGLTRVNKHDKKNM